MNDTLAYMSEDPMHRRHHHQKITFAPVYAFTENFVLALSHDEVVHGKGTLLGRMPGDDWQRFANLRAYLGFMYAHPGKKLLFMGGELGQWAEWNHDHALDWPLLDYPAHEGVQSLVRDLNGLYRAHPELHEQDFEAAGFEWVDWENDAMSVLSWLRRDRAGRCLLAVSNFTPATHDSFRLGCRRPVPGGSCWTPTMHATAAAARWAPTASIPSRSHAMAASSHWCCACRRWPR